MVTISQAPHLSSVTSPEQSPAKTSSVALPSNNEGRTATSIQRMHREGLKYRVPSPLLYHRRDREGLTRSSESLHEDPSQVQEQPSNDFIHTRPVLEVRPHKKAEQVISDTEEPEFCAARLPVMGGASPTVDHYRTICNQQNKHSKGNSIVRHPWFVTPAPPVIATINPDPSSI